MSKKQFLSSLILQSGVGRSEIAKATGMSNSHIAAMEKGEIDQVKRANLLFLSVGLNLEIDKTNTLLKKFGYLPLNCDDAKHFLEAATRRTISGFQSLLRGPSLHLILLSLEYIPGPIMIVSNRLLTIFSSTDMSEICMDTTDVDLLHRYYSNLYLRERRIAIEKNMKTYPLTHYMCKECLDDIIKFKCKSDPSLALQLDNTMSFMSSNSNYKLLLTNDCQSIVFELKKSDYHNEIDKALFGGQSVHTANPMFNFAGFMTDNKTICSRLEDQANYLSKERLYTSSSEETLEHIKRVRTGG